jgi:hypothetical protein
MRVFNLNNNLPIGIHIMPLEKYKAKIEAVTYNDALAYKLTSEKTLHCLDYLEISIDDKYADIAIDLLENRFDDYLMD